MFPPSYVHRYTINWIYMFSYLNKFCHLLAGEGRGNLQTYCPQFCGNQTHRRSHHLCSLDPDEYLYFANPCNFKTLDRFKHSWLATAADIWNGLPADVILQEKASGWCTILKDMQHCIYALDLYCMCMRFIIVNKVCNYVSITFIWESLNYISLIVFHVTNYMYNKQ